MPDLLKIINEHVPKIFETMASLKGIPGNGDMDPPRPSTLHGITGSVSVSGKACGTVYAAFSKNLANAVTIRMLGGDSPADDEVSDVIGEFTNMITGNLKSQLCDAGYACQLSIPTVMRGGDIAVEAKTAPICVRNTYYFEDLKEELVVLVFAKLDK
jgi:chemotaxis protein CheX